MSALTPGFMLGVIILGKGLEGGRVVESGKQPYWLQVKLQVQRIVVPILHIAAMTQPVSVSVCVHSSHDIDGLGGLAAAAKAAQLLCYDKL